MVRASEDGAQGSLQGLSAPQRIFQVQDIRAADNIPAAYEAGSRARTEGVLVTEESMFIVHRARLTEFAAGYKLPAVYSFLLPVTNAGGLMAYAVHAPGLASHCRRSPIASRPSVFPLRLSRLAARNASRVLRRTCTHNCSHGLQSFRLKRVKIIACPRLTFGPAKNRYVAAAIVVEILDPPVPIALALFVNGNLT
jgi:hypothetical protein